MSFLSLLILKKNIFIETNNCFMLLFVVNLFKFYPVWGNKGATLIFNT